MDKTKADYLFYYFIKTHELYILKMDKYREWVNCNKHHFGLAKLKNKRYNNSLYTSQGLIISKKQLEREFLNYKKVILNHRKIIF